MGDRAEIEVVCDNGESIFFYTHWNGSEVPQIVAQALGSPQGQSRMGDASYLNRILFCQLIELSGGTLGDETGFGISTTSTKDGRKVVFDHQNLLVTTEGYEPLDAIGQMTVAGFIENVGVYNA